MWRARLLSFPCPGCSLTGAPSVTGSGAPRSVVVAPGPRLSSVAVAPGLSCSPARGSPQTRHGPHALCIARRTLTRCASREALPSLLFAEEAACTSSPHLPPPSLLDAERPPPVSLHPQAGGYRDEWVLFLPSGGGLCDLRRRGVGGAAAASPACTQRPGGRGGGRGGGPAGEGGRAGPAPPQRPLSVSPAGSAGTPMTRSPFWRRSSSAAGERPLRGGSGAHRALQGSTRFRCSRTWAGGRQEAGHLPSLNRRTAPADKHALTLAGPGGLCCVPAHVVCKHRCTVTV